MTNSINRFTRQACYEMLLSRTSYPIVPKEMVKNILISVQRIGILKLIGYIEIEIVINNNNRPWELWTEKIY